MKYPITEKRVLEAVEAGMCGMENAGFCLECGADHDGCEPDAVNYECEECGELRVMGAENVLLSKLYTPANFTIPYRVTPLWIVKIYVEETNKKQLYKVLRLNKFPNSEFNKSTITFDFGNETDYRTFLDGLISNGINFSSEYFGPPR